MSEDLETGPQELGLTAPQGEPEEQPQPEKTPAQLLLEHIRDMTAKSEVAGMGELLLHPPVGLTRDEVKALLSGPVPDDALAEIARVEGKKDTYFYFKPYMTEHFAFTAVLLADKDVLETIAKTVRYNCKRYPRPTSFRQLRDSPYFFSEDVLLGAAARMQLSERYRDIRVVAASNGSQCFYSADIMSERYARSLAEDSEVDRYSHQ